MWRSQITPKGLLIWKKNTDKTKIEWIRTIQMSNDKQKFMHLLVLLSNAAAFVLMCSAHISCCYDSSYVDYPAIFVSAPKESLKTLNCLKNIFGKKNVCILLRKMIQHMQKWAVVLYTPFWITKDLDSMAISKFSLW